MQKPIKNVNKKIILIAGFVGTFICGASLLYIYQFCKITGYDCSGTAEYFWVYSLIFVPIFVCGVISFFIPVEVSTKWQKITYWFVPISLVLILLSPDIHEDFSPIEKDSTAMLMIGVYLLISLIFIVYKSIKLRGK